MLKKMLFVLCILYASISFSQGRDNILIDSIKSNWDYDLMKYHSCSNFPVGVYSLSFELDENLQPVYFQFSIDSLALLKQILINAIQKCSFNSFTYDSSKSYILLVYLNASFHCNETDIPDFDNKNIWKVVSQVQQKMLKTIEQTFNVLQHSRTFYFLPPLTILNKTTKSKVGLPEPDRKPRQYTKEEIDAMEKRIKEIKKAKEKSNWIVGKKFFQSERTSAFLGVDIYTARTEGIQYCDGEKVLTINSLFMRYFFLILVSAFLLSKGYSQIDRIASYRNYGQYVQPYINGWHGYNYKGELSEKKSDFEVITTFRIDTNGNVVNVNIKQHDSSQGVKSYISKLIMATSGGWLPQIKQSKIVLSDTITCCFFFYKWPLNETIEGRIERLDKELEKEFNMSKNEYDIVHEASKILSINSGKANYCFVILKF